MSTSRFGIRNAWANGAIPQDYEFNDPADTLDNQLAGLQDIAVVDGVLSGWGLTVGDDINVALGEGWVGGAHCKTTADQALTGITVSVLNYVYAQRKTPATARVSASYTLGQVDFVANTTGVAPSNAILIATGTANGAGTNFSAVNNDPNGRVTLRIITNEIATRFYEAFGEFVDSGLLPATDAGLGSDISLGVAYVRGYRVSKPSVTAHTYTASVDTYVDISSTGVFTYPEVATGAAAPAVTALSIRLAKVVTDGDNITSVVDLRVMAPVGLGTAADGTLAGQLNGKYQVFATHATPNTEVAVAHGLGRIPVGYIPVAQNLAGSIYTGATAWDITNIYFKCSVASVTVTMLIF